MKMPNLARLVALTMFVVGLTVTSGCNALSESAAAKSNKKSFFDRMPWSNQDEPPEPYPNPVKVAATWTPDTLVQTGRTPTRGFGGRVFFYDEKSRPVPVDGTLVIHGFDDGADSQEKRVKRFEFTPEQFTRHFSQSDLGASYSVWIPWDAIGGPQRRISLVTSFRTSQGQTVQGVPVTVLLPGISKETKQQAEVAKRSPQYQRYLEAARNATVPTTGLTTTTIARHRPRRMNTATSTTPNFREARTDSIASKSGSTPSIEVGMKRLQTNQSVMPASANVPVR